MSYGVGVGIALCVMGLCMLILPSNLIWMMTDRWKVKSDEGPSESYGISMKILGVLVIVLGVVLIILGRR